MIVTLMLRNLKIYRRDKQTVFFSVLGVLIVILLYILFLGKAVKEQIGSIYGAQLLVDTYIMSGVLSVCTVTTTLGAYGIFVDDYLTHRQKDFFASPINRFQIDCGYILSSMVVGFIISIITFLFAQIYIGIKDGVWMELYSSIQVILVLACSILSAGSLSFLCVCFIKSQGAYSGINVILGTLIGFITGVYIPMGGLSERMQHLVKCFPISHGAVLLRKIIMKDALSQSFRGESALFIDACKRQLGVVYYVGEYQITNEEHILFLLLSSSLFFTSAQFINRRIKEYT